MQTITQSSFQKVLNQLQGKKVEVSVSSTLSSINTYDKFKWRIENYNGTFYDFSDLKGQNLSVPATQIKEIQVLNEENVYETVLELKNTDGTIIFITVADNPIKCSKCGKILNDEYNAWKIKGHGGYGSHWDGEEVNLVICDQCLYDFINGGNKDE